MICARCGHEKAKRKFRYNTRAHGFERVCRDCVTKNHYIKDGKRAKKPEPFIIAFKPYPSLLRRIEV